MAGINVTISPELERLPERLTKALETGHESAARAVLNEVRAKIVEVDAVASKGLLNSVQKQFQSRGLIKAWLVGSDLDYATFVEAGRPKGKQPPVAAIQRWMAFKGITGDRGIAFAIARTIGKRGVKGRYPFKLAVEAARPDVEAAIAAELGKLQSEIGQ